MARIQKKKLRWQALDPSAVKIRIYICPSNEIMDYSKQYVEIDASDTHYELPGDFTLNEAEYKIGASQLDSYGNEATIQEITYFFDFTPPAPLAGLAVVDL